MRVRITRARQGEIDGVRLDTFEVGEIYDLPAELGTYLIITASAVPVDVAGTRFLPFETRIAVPSRERAAAADRGRPRRARRTKRS